MMRFVTVVLVLICCVAFHSNAFAQDDFTGNITTLSGENLIGKIKTDKNLFSEVQFVGLDGKMTKYGPGEIKGFSIKYPQQRLPVYYESMQLDSIGNVFAQRRFSDGKIKNYYTEYEGRDRKQKVDFNFYTVADTIFQINANSSTQNHPMQVIIKEKSVNTAGRYSSLIQFYYIKKQSSDEILRILDKKTSPTFPKKYIEKINQWFQDYPALAEAIISGNLTNEWFIATLYNIHYSINNAK